MGNDLLFSHVHMFYGVVFFRKSNNEWLDMKTGHSRRFLYEENIIYMLLYKRRSA